MTRAKSIVVFATAFLFTIATGFQIHAQTGGATYTIRGKVLSVTSDGLLIQCTHERGTKTSAGGTVHVTGHPNAARLVDGKPVTCVGSLVGTYQYTSALGAKRTVEQFTFVR